MCAIFVFPLPWINRWIRIWMVEDSLSLFFLQHVPMIHRETISQGHVAERLVYFVRHFLRKRSMNELHQLSNHAGPSVTRNSCLSLVHAYWYFTLFVRWLLTVCHFSSVSLVSLSVSMVSSIFIAAFSLASCLMAFSSVCLIALTIILDLFDPRFEEVGEGESLYTLPIPRRFFTQSIVGSINEERNWFEERKMNWKTEPKISAQKKMCLLVSSQESLVWWNHLIILDKF